MSQSEQLICSEDLTTDAVPSPPRDDPTTKPDMPSNSQSANKKTTRKKRKIPQGCKFLCKSLYITNSYMILAHTNIVNINNSKTVHVGPNIVINYGNEKQNRNNIREPDNEIKKFFCNCEPLSRKHLTFISKHIDEKWKKVGRKLGYSEGQMAQFVLNHKELGYEEVNKHEGLKPVYDCSFSLKVIFQMLLDWIQDKPDEATVGQLAKVLWKCEQQEAVERWHKEIE